MKLYALLSVILLLLGTISGARANNFTHRPWTGDASTGIDAGSTLWAYHFGSSTAATVNGVTVPGLTGLNPAVSGKFSFSVPARSSFSDTNALTGLSGQGSAIMASAMVRYNTPVTLTLQGLNPGAIYTVSLFKVGDDLAGLSGFSTLFTSNGASLPVGVSAYGLNNGIRVDCTFTASGSTHAITMSTPSYESACYALALKIHSGHAAYVFRTDSDPIPAEVEAAIMAHGGPDTAILSFGPGAGGLINGVPVYDMGAVTLKRYDPITFTQQPGANPQARHFIIAGNLTLTSQMSFWGTGNLLLKLEVLNYATLQPGSLISVAAQGRIGGAGGGDGGLAAAHPVVRGIIWDPVSYSPAAGSTNGKGEDGDDGQPVLTQGSSGVLNPSDYVRSITGAAGVTGQGDDYFYQIPDPLGVLQFQTVRSSSAGGAGIAYTNGYPEGGAGGDGGNPGLSSPTATNGFNGQNGQAGGDGADGRDGGHGAVMTLAGSAIHLRGGSGGGAGGTGGHGLGGRTGGGGGGGGASGTDVLDPSPAAGGAGGEGGTGGLPGASGTGGSGGGGGGGLLLVVRGTLLNQGTILANGSNGSPGQAGTPGLDGEAGGGGTQGVQRFIGLDGGNGGNGGKGGRGGRGGNGGNGAPGSGGNIQIAAGNYQAFSPTINTSGGVGAPAGLVQIHAHNEVSQNAPFGNFAAGLSSYRSYTLSSSLFPQPVMDPALVPYLPLEGGPATSGLAPQTNVSDVMLTGLVPPVNAAAAVIRIPASAFFQSYPDHDLIVFTSLKSGQAVNGPRLSLINSSDANEAVTGNAWLPTGPQFLRYNTGDASNPAFVTGATGPTIGPIPWNRGFMTLVERGKPFEVTAEYGPYSLLRRFIGTPALAGLGGAPNYTSGTVYLYDKGLMRSSVKGQNLYNFNAVISQSESEQGDSISGETFARVGVPPVVSFSATNLGNAWSRAAGGYTIRYTPPGGSETTAPFTYTSIAGGASAFSQTITVAAGTVANTQQFIGEFTLLPDYDLGGPQPIVHQVYANVLGPQSSFSGLTGTAFGPGVHFSTAALTAATQSIQITNTAPVRSEWLTFANANPAFTRLGIVSAGFVGPNASAFSVTAPSTLDRNASGNIAITFTPPSAGSFSATLRLVTDEGVNNGVAGRTIDIPVTAFVGFMETYDTWSLALPPALRDRNADADGNGIPNFMDYGLRGAMLPSLTSFGPSAAKLDFTIPVADRSDVRWSIQGSSNLQSWQTLATRSTTGAWSLANPADALTEAISGGSRQLSFTRNGADGRYFMRLTANPPDISSSYTNDFATAVSADLYGTAEWHNAGIRLTNSLNDQMGSAILSGVEVWPSQTGFRAAFNLTTGPGSIPNPADGASFSVGQLPNNEWGEDGPEAFESARNLTICFDTNGTSGGFEVQRGIRIRVNRDLVLYSPVNPYSNGAARAVEIIYTPAEGLTVRFNGSNVFTNVTPGTFALQPGDRFGFGGRTGGLNQVNRIDDVVIEPR